MDGGEYVSIHAPRAGRDVLLIPVLLVLESVSIHAPRAGRDLFAGLNRLVKYGFNPRAPRGARRHKCTSGRRPSSFQSTRPARGATVLP